MHACVRVISTGVERPWKSASLGWDARSFRRHWDSGCSDCTGPPESGSFCTYRPYHQGLVSGCCFTCTCVQQLASVWFLLCKNLWLLPVPISHGHWRSLPASPHPHWATSGHACRCPWSKGRGTPVVLWQRPVLHTSSLWNPPIWLDMWWMWPSQWRYHCCINVKRFGSWVWMKNLIKSLLATSVLPPDI